MELHKSIVLDIFNKNFNGVCFPQIINTVIHPNSKPIEFNSKVSNDLYSKNINIDKNKTNMFMLSNNYPKGYKCNNYGKCEYNNFNQNMKFH